MSFSMVALKFLLEIGTYSQQGRSSLVEEVNGVCAVLKQKILNFLLLMARRQNDSNTADKEKDGSRCHPREQPFRLC